MAAPPAKPSPSNKEVQQTTDETATLTAVKATSTADAPVEVNASANKENSPTDDAVILPPSYESSESSEHCVLAKQLLAEGDFEQALSTIEQGIETYKALLMSMGVEPDLHECMAPFHYLYGTTLLYSIEESTDMQMTVGQDTSTVQPEVAAAAATMPSSEPEPAAPAESAEDMEIAWENLDTARNIVERLLTQDSVTEFMKSKLQLDLAHILLREGDLQRMNGRYTEAIHDYEACLQLRELLLPPFDRKIADAQYNLGLSYLSYSSELQKHENPDAAKQKVSQEHCLKGTELYVECARTLCGQIAALCGVDSSAVLSTSNEGKAGFKTTGLVDATEASHAIHMLSVWRKNVSTLTPTEALDPTVEDLRQLLDEIQETVDEAERSQEAVRQACQLKVQAQKFMSQDGATTQIGFGKPSLQDVVAQTKPAATPMMVVKRKKKRDSPEEEKPNADAKRAKAE
jgi:tetratricopeptide (TPR) repeat protein